MILLTHYATRRFQAAPPSASFSITGTAADSIETAIVAGGDFLLITLTGETFLGTLDNTQKQTVINGLVSSGSETNGWNNQVVPALSSSNVTQNSSTQLTITLPAVAGYDITTNETITPVLDGSVLTAGNDLTSSNSFSIAASVGGGGPPPFTGEPTWLTNLNLTLHQWGEIPGTKISSAQTADWVTVGANTMISAWGGMAIDPWRSILYNMAGGGHGDGYGNQVAGADLGQNTPSWSELWPPSAAIQVPLGGNVPYYLDGYPASRHQYWSLQFDTATRRVIGVGSPAVFDPAAHSYPDTPAFNAGTNTYDPEGYINDMPISCTADMPTCQDPYTELIYTTRQTGGMQVLDAVARTWSTHAITFPGGFDQVPLGYPMALDHSRNRIFLAGFATGGSTAVLMCTIDISTFVITNVTLSGPHAADIVNPVEWSMFYDPNTDSFLMRGPYSGPTVYMINASTFSVDVLDTGGTGTLLPFAQNHAAAGTFNRFLYCPQFQLALYVPSYSENIWALRLSSALPLGALAHDGEATPEQISLTLPIVGVLGMDAVATCRYRESGTRSWTRYHNLHRIVDTDYNFPNDIPDAFAFPIIRLRPGTTYDVEVTVTCAAGRAVRVLTHTTRALPSAAGVTTKTISAGSDWLAIQTVLYSAVPGDVIVFENGTYDLGGKAIQIGTPSGSAAAGDINGAPIYIRGQSRSGVIINQTVTANIFEAQVANNYIIEDLTFNGFGVDGHSGCFVLWNNVDDSNNPLEHNLFTFRRLTVTGVDLFFGTFWNINQILVYSNTITGNNLWQPSFLESNITWDDDGINLGGHGNCAWENTIKGFGDSCSHAANSAGITDSRGVHFYRNEIINSGDDANEADYAKSNCTFYDNRIRNSMTLNSLDPLRGGPFLCCGNICINTGRGPFKWQDTQTGIFVYHNTIVRTTGYYATVLNDFNAEAGWWLSTGIPYHVAYVNNMLVYRGSGTQTFRMDPHYPIITDWCYNAWSPDATFQWSDVTRASLALIKTAVTPTQPMNFGQTLRHANDVITVSNPWTTTITLGSNYRTEILTPGIVPVVSDGDNARSSGVAIPGINDGYTGPAPDMGATIHGRTIPVFGDQS